MASGTQERDVVREHLALSKSETARRIEREFKVPTCGTIYPSVFWIACVVVPAEDGSNLHGAICPEDFEVVQIASYIDFKLTSFYNESCAARTKERALPVVAGHNTVTFVKLPAEQREGWSESAVGWGYRRTSWQTASWPHGYPGSAKQVALPLTLLQVLDKIEDFGSSGVSPKWTAWKAEHADVFPAA